MTKKYRSWGFIPSKEQRAQQPAWRDFKLPLTGMPWLPRGNGRSYGDSCLNSAGTLIDSTNLSRVIRFDEEAGVLKCEAGLLFSDLLELVVPKGWFLPVTPGTSFVTVGGALANDVHGKNHHREGCFGNHVECFEIRRSDGSAIECSLENNVELFKATIGGLGLTGFVTWVEIRLIPISTSNLKVETIPFQGLEAFHSLSTESAASHQYTVSWLDCVSGGDQFARGIFLRANHIEAPRDFNQKAATELRFTKAARLSVPFNLPAWCLSRFSVGVFNAFYFRLKSKLTPQFSEQSLKSFFFPLDSVKSWNRIYGKAGFFQCQFVIPSSSRDVLGSILRSIVDSGQASFLAVLKDFGEIRSPGLLSFPRSGVCLALDFPDRGRTTRKLLEDLELQVLAANGAMYPAKDRTMSAEAFKQYHPELERFSASIDPGVSSDFWRRVNG